MKKRSNKTNKNILSRVSKCTLILLVLTAVSCNKPVYEEGFVYSANGNTWTAEDIRASVADEKVHCTKISSAGDFQDVTADEATKHVNTICGYFQIDPSIVAESGTPFNFKTITAADRKILEDLGYTVTGTEPDTILYIAIRN